MTTTTNSSGSNSTTPPTLPSSFTPSKISATAAAGGRAILSNVTAGEGGMRTKIVGQVKLNNNNNEKPGVKNNSPQMHSLFLRPPPPPDKRLQSMEILMDKILQAPGPLSSSLSVQDYHQRFWSNDNAFYSSWLEASGKTNVHVGQWQRTMANNDDDQNYENDDGIDIHAIVNPWDGETYDCYRLVTFQFQRTATHLYTTGNNAMMLAHVKQTQYCRVDENQNRCVVSMTIETQGVPFSDAFYVQLRWVATTRGTGAAATAAAASSSSSSLHIQVGMVVVFTKPVIVANKLRAGVKEETAKTQVDLFRCMKTTACCSNADRDRTGTRAVPALPQKANRRSKSCIDDLLLLAKDHAMLGPFHRRLAGAVVMCFPFLAKDNNNDQGNREGLEQDEKNNNRTTVQDELDQVQQMLRTVRALPQSTTTNAAKEDTQKAHVLSQCTVVLKALNALIVRERCLEKSHAAAQRNRLAAQSSRSMVPNIENDQNHLNHQQLPPALQPIAQLYDKVVGHVRASVTQRNLLLPNQVAEHEAAPFDAGPDPEPDKVLKGMNVIVSKTIDNATVMDVYKLLGGGDDAQVKEGESTAANSQPSFYRSWLESTDRSNVQIEPWSVAPTPGEGFADGWSNETFEKRRVVTARVLKSKFMKEAPPAVLAKQTMQQFCRLHGHDRLVMASSIKVDHFAFANKFEVCIRWVVSRVGRCNVSVKIGMFVLFLQPTLLESKIRAGALKESQRLKLNLCRRVRDAINSNGSNTSTARRFSFDDKRLPSSMALRGSISPATSTTHWLLPIEQFCIPKMQKLTKLYPACMLDDDADLQREFQQIQLQLQTVKSLLPAATKETSSDLSARTMENDDDDENDKNERRLNFIQSELRVAYEALNNVVVWHGNAQDGPQTLAAASFANNTTSS